MRFETYQKEKEFNAVLGYSIAVLVSTLLWVLIFFCISSVVHAEEVSTSRAVYCVMGEARGESFQGQVAVAESIRNRIKRMGVERALRRVDGCHAKFKYTKAELFKAQQAWRISKASNLVKGADHWFADWIPTPYWAKKSASPNSEMTAKYGSHLFFKGIK